MTRVKRVFFDGLYASALMIDLGMRINYDWATEVDFRVDVDSSQLSSQKRY